ncbi:hypothetical protein ASE86_06770 [Sphingomonas sp. Leaf33]|uniref:hypothetical protein n=1 Tax=Sphingomonas sp. Leaf33 TaxID=1736215 RepID=UPI0006FF00AE|nr:hypothetical protein [Sphingomonas sp. Leaf33]KQN25889.1 hypothetical protein ASE86_06770 [Sphingomonas sp. Leaf33]
MRSNTLAGRRYLRRFWPTMLAYVAALFFAVWAIKTWQPTGILLVALSILPALPIIAIIGVIGLYIVEETDEFIRARVVRAMLIGMGFMLAVSSAWGFLEDGGVVPHAPAYWAFILWCIGWGFAQCVQGLRDRMAGSGEEA